MNIWNFVCRENMKIYKYSSVVKITKCVVHKIQLLQLYQNEKLKFKS